jgi:hypothetical protein
MTAAEHPVNPEELMAYVDGELPVERSALVHAHLSDCDACQRLSGELRGVSRDLSRWRVEDTPKTLRAPERSNGTAARNPIRTSSLRLTRTLPLAGVAAVGILVLAAGTWTMMQDQPAITRPRPVSAQEGRSVAVPKAVEISVSGAQAPAPSGPMIARTARLQIMTRDFDAARPAVDRIVADMGGLIGQVDISHVGSDSRSIRATLLVPANRLDAALEAFKALGTVVQESQSGEDVTEQVRDLDVRLANSRNTEKRLNDLLQKRTGDLADVLAAEREVARVREEIERMDAERKNVGRRVTYATISLEAIEQRKAALDLGPLPVSMQFRNALVDGFRNASQSALDAALFAVRVGPVILLWALVLAWPARMVWRWKRRPTNA